MNYRSNNAGFTLIELAVSLAVMGLVIVMCLQIAIPLTQQRKVSVTKDNMARIINTLSVYAQRNSRIPCPADPTTTNTTQPVGAEVGSGASGNAMPTLTASGCMNNGVAYNEGIVPYRTLGLIKTDVIDAHGNYYTYRVNANFARDPTIANNVHGWCRSSSWISGVLNRNPMRARFCCSDKSLAGQELSVTDASGVALYPFTRDNSNYAAVDTLYAGPTLTQTSNNITTVIFVLVSHGENRSGAFLEDGNRSPSLSNTGTSESENGDADTTYIYRTRVELSGTAHYDDVVAWRTQDQVFAETGSGSCALP